jgi:type IV pilus assembly protein PilM
MEVVLVSVKEEVIYEHLDLIKKGGVTTWNINVETFAVEDSYTLSPNYEAGKEEVIALIDIGARITNMNILENGISVFNRDIMIGGNDFTEAIRKEMGLLDFSQAEEMKLTVGSLAVEDRFRSQRAYGDGERFMGVYYAIEPIATRLLDELDRSFAYYYTQLPSYKKSIDKVILSGGGAALKGLDIFLKEGLNMKLEYNDPFVGIEIPPTLPNITLVEKEKLRFATACGLARRGLL